MGIYTPKYLLETELTSVQDPDNVGNDLEQIEKDIMGPEGIEAHAEEIEDAQSGVVGDPLEEAYMIMYESEYNYNQLLECIGLHELHAASKGCYLVLEAEDQLGFIERVKEIFKRAWTAIVNAFKNILQKIQEETKFDKKFVEKYESEIRAGAAEWLKGEVSELPEGYGFAAIKMQKNSYSYPDYSDFSNENLEAEKGKIVSHCSGTDATTIKDMQENLRKSVYGDKIVAIKDGNLSVGNLIDVLKGENEMKDIKACYNEIKDWFNGAMKTLNDMKSEYLKGNKADNEGNKADLKAGKEDIINKHNFRCKLYRHEMAVQTHRYMFYVKAAIAKRAQARHLCHQCKAKAPADTAKNESVAINQKGFFTNMQFV